MTTTLLAPLLDATTATADPATVPVASIDFAAVDGFGDPIDYDGTCSFCEADWGLDDRGRLPEHNIAGGRQNRPRCTGSGQLGRAPHRRRYFYREGVHWL